jgi:hypothetical protein
MFVVRVWINKVGVIHELPLLYLSIPLDVFNYYFFGGPAVIMTNRSGWINSLAT